MTTANRENDYYAAGNKELATETALTVKRLEPRRLMTKNSTRLVIALVGLPARGKSFVSRKLQHYLNWTGVQCEIFNVGKYRREAFAELNRTVETPTKREKQGACDANFFDANNEQASELREKVAECALNDMLRWLDEEDNLESDDDNERSFADSSRHSSVSVVPDGAAKLSFRKPRQRVAIFDATNSTHKRRQWILEQCTSPEKRSGKQTGVVFVESICDDQELLEENYRYKTSSSPDFAHLNVEDALDDLRQRVRKYEAQYETITDDSQSYIKIFNLSTKLMVNHIYGRMAKEVVPALMAWHIGTRPVFLCRPGQTISGILTDGEDYVNRKKINVKDFQDMSSTNKRRSMRGDTLGPNGLKFREELYDFCHDESLAFMSKKRSVRDNVTTGTSISGLAPGPGAHRYASDRSDPESIPDSGSMAIEPFPLRIYTSTMPRASDTVNWEDFMPNQRSNLNPLDKGDFAGLELEEMKREDPSWYERLQKDPFNTRFPGGENYRDLMSRLTSVVIDLEQEVVPTLLVSHVSILQCLMAYFRNTRVEKCMSIEVPLHTVVKFTPVRGGGWSESHHPFYEIPIPVADGVGMNSVMSEMSLAGADHSSSSTEALTPPPAPIWGDDSMSPRSMSHLTRSHSHKVTTT